MTLPRPTGLFVTCDRWGTNLCELARETHIVVPEDLAIVAPGNDFDMASVSQPALSIIDQPWESIGSKAAALLADMMAGAGPRLVALSPQHVQRCTSTNSLATADAHVRQAVAFIHHHAHQPIGVRDVLKSVHSSRARWKCDSGGRCNARSWRKSAVHDLSWRRAFWRKAICQSARSPCSVDWEAARI